MSNVKAWSRCLRFCVKQTKTCFCFQFEEGDRYAHTRKCLSPSEFIFSGDVFEMGAFRDRFILFVINTSAFEYSCCSLHGQEEKKSSKCHWHFCCSHHVRYFQRNDWSKPAVSSISLDSHESKVTCVFLQSCFTCIVCISRDHLSWFAQAHGVYVYICVCCDTWLM